MWAWLSTIYDGLNGFTSKNPFLVFIAPFLLTGAWGLLRRLSRTSPQEEMKYLNREIAQLEKAKGKKRTEVALDLFFKVAKVSVLCLMVVSVCLSCLALYQNGISRVLLLIEITAAYTLFFYATFLFYFVQKAERLLYPERYLPKLQERLLELKALQKD